VVTAGAEWIGSGAIGVSALLLVAVAARLGSHTAHHAADQEQDAYRAERDRLAPPPAPTPIPFEIPPVPDLPPADPVHDQTLELHEVKAYRARHRKEPTACS
jgi:hypothetical protein